MTAPFDDVEFVDRDLPAQAPARVAPPSPPPAAADVGGHPPTRAELDAKVGSTQDRIAELKRAQEALERERATLEDARRRRAEFETGRAEMLQQLTRGTGLLAKAEFDARRDAEQMAKTLASLQDALAQVQAIREDSWTQESWHTDLSRALTTIENARLEWNGARLKWKALDGTLDTAGAPGSSVGTAPAPDWLARRSLVELCRVGLALTWPVALVLGLAFVAVGLVLWLR